MRHAILTRLGIGIARSSFYRQHIEMLKEGLFKNLTHQTNAHFEWYVCVDKLMDRENKTALEELLAPYANFHLVMFDPLKKGRLLPYWRDFAENQDDRPLLLTRIDDDDCVHTRFVEIVQDFVLKALKTETRFSCAVSNGIEISTVEQKFRKRVDHETSVGLTTVTGEGDVIDVYKGGHRNFSARMAKVGLKHHTIETAEPYWIYTVREQSDSYQNKMDIASRHQDLNALAFNTLESCGLPRDWIARLDQIFSQFPDYISTLHGNGPLKRLNIKQLLLSDVRDLQKAGDRESDRYKALVAGFYAI